MCQSVFDVCVYCIYTYIYFLIFICIHFHIRIYQILNPAWDE